MTVARWRWFDVLGLVASRRGRLSVPAIAAPVNLAIPVISGLAQVGQPLVCSPGEWAGHPFPTLSYQWLRDGFDLLGASSAEYGLTPFDAGHDIACRVTAINAAGSATAASLGIVIPETILGDVWPTAGVWPADGVWPSDTGPEPEPPAWPTAGVWPTSGTFYG